MFRLVQNAVCGNNPNSLLMLTSGLKRYNIRIPLSFLTRENVLTTRFLTYSPQLNKESEFKNTITKNNNNKATT